MGLIDEISTERIHIEEKIRGTFLSICLLESLIYHGLVVLIIFETMNVLMTVDASCRLLFLFLSGSSQERYAYENSSIVCRVPL